MSARERDLFESLARCCESYVEFGSGGSTWLAAQRVKRSVLALDSAKAWLDRVEAACADSPVRPDLVFVDIGAIGEWGHPVDLDRREDWPRYPEAVWDRPASRGADLYMVDGRFRVACFAQVVANGPSDALIAFHDYASRPEYHCVEAIARPVARAEDLTVFAPRPGARADALTLARAYRYEPA